MKIKVTKLNRLTLEHTTYIYEDYIVYNGTDELILIKYENGKEVKEVVKRENGYTYKIVIEDWGNWGKSK